MHCPSAGRLLPDRLFSESPLRFAPTSPQRTSARAIASEVEPRGGWPTMRGGSKVISNQGASNPCRETDSTARTKPIRSTPFQSSPSFSDFTDYCLLITDYLAFRALH